MNQILPKLWLEAVQSIWDKKVPTDYPRTKSEFSLIFDSKDVESKVKEMEENLKTEDSILSNITIPENTFIDSYLGTYNVKGTPGELTLLSPQKVASNIVDVIVMHLDEETEEWKEVEDAQIIDNYVYGTLDSFSPIAVFGIKRETYLVESCEAYNAPTFICNGIPVFLSTNEEGKIVVLDGNNKETVLPDDCRIIMGGTIDGTDLKSTSIYIDGVDNNKINVIGGSFFKEVVNVGEINITIKNSTLNVITGSSYFNRAENVNITIEDSIIASACGIGESQWTKGKKDANKAESKGLASNAYVKNGKMNIKNSKIPILYAAGNCGYLYVDNCTATIDGGDYTYITVCGSNGHSKDIKVKVSNANVKVITLTNRGIVDSADVSIKNSTVENILAGGELDDKTVDGIVKKIRIDICTGTNGKLLAGSSGGEKLNAVKASEIIESLKISRSTNIEIDNEDKLILGDVIKIK